MVAIQPQFCPSVAGRELLLLGGALGSVECSMYLNTRRVIRGWLAIPTRLPVARRPSPVARLLRA
jgi:hypothetical protein